MAIKGKGGMRYGWEIITPEMASELLSRNTHNRNRSEGYEQMYASIMAAGLWKRTTQGIHIAEDGTLLDGQTRLHAVVLANRPVELFVTRDEPPDVQEALDIGRCRRVSDIYALRGVMHAKQVTSTCRALWILDHEGGLPHRPISNQEIDGLYEKYEIGLAWRTSAEASRKLSSNYYFAPLVWCYPEFSTEVQVFNQSVQRGDCLALIDPALVLRTWLLASPPRGGATATRDVIMKTCSALLAAIEGRPMQRLQIGEHGYVGLRRLKEAASITRPRSAIGGHAI
jgi:hypothetical protein